MQTLLFKKRVSKGTKFNQIYVPKELEDSIQPGDLVEVRLIEKQINLFFHNVTNISKFKKELITTLFQFLQKFNVDQIFIVGSFLSEKTEYNDIDLVLIVDKLTESFEKKVYEELVKEFSLKFHLLSIQKENLEKLLNICPLTRSMFERFASNKEFQVNQKKIIDNNHLQMLLMMPEDLLELELNSRTYFDSLRRLITIKNFLSNKSLNCEKITEELKGIIGEKLCNFTRNNEPVDIEIINILRKHISQKINEINQLMK